MTNTQQVCAWVVIGRQVALLGLVCTHCFDHLFSEVFDKLKGSHWKTYTQITQWLNGERKSWKQLFVGNSLSFWKHDLYCKRRSWPLIVWRTCTSLSAARELYVQALGSVSHNKLHTRHTAQDRGACIFPTWLIILITEPHLVYFVFL